MPVPLPALAHVGVAVPRVTEALAFYRDVLGVTPRAPESADGATIVSLPFGDVDVELLEPRDPDGPVAKFLDEDAFRCFPADKIIAMPPGRWAFVLRQSDKKLISTNPSILTVPAPGRFSITNCLPKLSLIFCAASRIVTSAMPPAPYGTTILTGRDG